MTTALFVQRACTNGYRDEGYWRFNVARSGQSATSDRELIGGSRQSRSSPLGC